MLPPEMMMHANSAQAAGRMHDELMRKEMQKQQFLNNSNKQVEFLQQQINLLNQQLEESKTENKKLNELCGLKNKELEDSKKELKRSRIYNGIMLGISIASLVATILFGIIL